MLSLDIETTDIDPKVSQATVACTYDGTTPKSYHFMKSGEDHAQNAENLFLELDKAESICGYNCIRFDIPYLQNKYEIDEKRVEKWIAKCIDPFPFLVDELGTYCKLSVLLSMNGMQSKSASGKDAIDMANNQDWENLEKYCARDAKLTWELLNLPKIKVPVIHIMGMVADIQFREKWRVCVPIVKKTRPKRIQKVEIPSLFD